MNLLMKFMNLLCEYCQCCMGMRLEWFSLENPLENAAWTAREIISINVMEFNDETTCPKSELCNKVKWYSDLMSTQQWRERRRDRERKIITRESWVTGNSLSVMEALEVRANSENYYVYYLVDIRSTLPSVQKFLFCWCLDMELSKWRNRMTVFRNFYFIVNKRDDE
jgi:hypothetical protein